MGLLQWKSLQASQSSPIESLYGLKRVSNNGNPSFDNGLSTTQKAASFAYLIILPRIMVHLREAAKRTREATANTNNNAVRPGEQNSLNSLALPDSNSNASAQDFWLSVPSSVNSILAAGTHLQEQCKQFLAHSFPYLEFAGDMSVLVYQLMYVCGKSRFHHPLFALFGMSLEKRNTNATRLARNEAPAGDAQASSVYPNWPVVIVLSLVLAVRAAEYLQHNSNNLEASSLSARLEIPLPIPPVPKAANIGRGCVVPPIDASLCALCAKPRINSCASNSGYVFCYMCILPYVREHSVCPVTGLYCAETGIIRLFEDK